MFLMLLKLVSYVEQECIYLMENTVNIYSEILIEFKKYIV